MRRFLRWLLPLCLFLISSTALQTKEEMPTEHSHLAKSVVKITRYFSGDKRNETEQDGVRVSGTAWFLSPKILVTVSHVVEKMSLSNSAWLEIEVEQVDQEGIPSHIETRQVRLINATTVDRQLALIEIKVPWTGGQVLSLRRQPLSPGEPLISVAYPKGVLRYAVGSFTQYEPSGSSEKTAHYALLELYRGMNRLVIDQGASGGPILDSQGRVALVIENVISERTDTGVGPPMRVPTPWYTPNVVGTTVNSLISYVP